MVRHPKVIVIKRDGTDSVDLTLDRIKETPFMIGREEGMDVRITNQHVSRRHCKISLIEGHVCLTNLSSANPTLLNGKKIRDPTELRDADVLTVVDRRFRINLPRCREEPDDSGDHVILVGSSGSSAEEDSEYEWIYQPDLHEEAPPPANHLPAELEERPEQPFDTTSDAGMEDNVHIGQWREADLGALAMAINFYREELKGKFDGAAGGKERRDKAWDSVAEYINTRCGTSWTVDQCKGKLSKYTQEVKQRLHRNRAERTKTGGGVISEQDELSNIDEMFLDYAGVEGVIEMALKGELRSWLLLCAVLVAGTIAVAIVLELVIKGLGVVIKAASPAGIGALLVLVVCVILYRQRLLCFTCCRKRTFFDFRLKEFRFVNVDLLSKSNRSTHKTECYHNKGLIVRRGWSFTIKVTLSDALHKDTDTIFLNFYKTDPGTKFSEKTRVVLRCENSGESSTENGWAIKMVGTNDKEVTLEVTPDVNALVGNYNLAVQTHRRDAGIVHISRARPAAKLILLFNAFHKDDDVYIEDDEHRDEYVMKKTGIIYKHGFIDKHGCKDREIKQDKINWRFGQFEESILEVALSILDNSNLEEDRYGKAVQVTKELAAQMRDKVLYGNWSGDYRGGKAPGQWTNSVDILKQFHRTKKVVKFGQCWVFSGILTTVTRALGIGCRSVTNIESAHDTDRSNTIDHVFDEDGDPIGNDYMWNFHVWNECWMRRQDLPSGYDGWQAFDGTPHVGYGPAPVKAIYKGQVDILYDAPVFFSAVNADTVYWKMVKGERKVSRIITNDIGLFISTKQVGGDEREDITNHYKPAEGDKERVNAMNAMRRGTKWKELVKEYEEHKLDVTYEMTANRDDQGDCHVTVDITNTSSEERTVIGKINMFASYNVRPSREKLHEPHVINLPLAAEQSETVTWDVPAVAYFSKLDDDAMVQMNATFSVKGTDQFWSNMETLNIKKPDMVVTVEKEEVERGEPFEVKLSFTNPFNAPITDIVVDAEGPGLEKELEPDVKKELGPKEKFTASITLTARIPGRWDIIASFNGKQLQGITGTAVIKVKGIEVIEHTNQGGTNVTVERYIKRRRYMREIP